MFNDLLTDRVRALLQQVESLKTGAPVQIEAMEDEHLKATSAGAAVVTSPGAEVVYLDPERADEYALAHELMHIYLHRRGWPQVFGMVGRDFVGRRLANTIDNILDHAIFDPWLSVLGFDVRRHHERFFAGFNSWPENEGPFPSYLWNGLLIWECFLFGKDYRDRAIQLLRARHPKAVSLARELEKQWQPARSRTKRGNRQAMIQVVDFLNRWVGEQMKGQRPNWRDRIGITPLFSQEDLTMPATEHFTYKIHQSSSDQYDCLIGGVYLKADGTCIRGYLDYDRVTRPAELQQVETQVLSGALGSVLESEGIRFGLLGNDDGPTGT